MTICSRDSFILRGLVFVVVYFDDHWGCVLVLRIDLPIDLLILRSHLVCLPVECPYPVSPSLRPFIICRGGSSLFHGRSQLPNPLGPIHLRLLRSLHHGRFLCSYSTTVSPLRSPSFRPPLVSPSPHTPKMDSGPRSSSRPRPSSRPTTPLRPSSRSSLREAHDYAGSTNNASYTQPPINALEPQFAELADSMADLEANFMHMQLMHESLTRFSESFASFLYGLNMNAFCVDFPEVRSADAMIKTNLLNAHHRPRLPTRFAERSSPSRRKVGYAQRVRMTHANHSDADDPIRSTEEAEMTFL